MTTPGSPPGVVCFGGYRRRISASQTLFLEKRAASGDQDFRFMRFLHGPHAFMLALLNRPVFSGLKRRPENRRAMSLREGKSR
jgi:hypothetical protein